MSDLNVRIDTSDTRVLLRLEDLPKKLQAKLEQTIRGLTNELHARVVAKEPVRTGFLRRQTRAYVDQNTVKQFVRGRVRVLNARDKNIAAGFGALEYGSTGKKFPVKAYTRGGSTVRGYDRRGGIRAQRFLRTASAAMLPKARAELRRVIETFKA